jgi:hypothetical protein
MTKPFLLCMALLGTCAAMLAADFWEQKEYTEWNEKEVRKLLLDSPWSKQIQVSLRGDSFTGTLPAGVGGPNTPRTPGGAEPGFPGQDQRGGIAGGVPQAGGGIGDSDVGSRSIPLVIRWVSALPVKQALVQSSATGGEGNEGQSKQFLDREETHYIVAVVGLPDGISRSLRDENQLKTAARIERGKNGTPLNPEKVETRQQDSQTAVYFFFPRTEPISLEDKSVRFWFTLPELEVKREFKLQNMVYRDKLEI